MAEETNQHGLTRHIPEGVKREVRQNSGFGCVLCGSAFYEYEHFNPEFKDAKQHQSLGITLLCENHHGAKTRGTLGQIAISKAVKDPFCKREGFSFGPLDFGNSNPKVQIASTLFINPKSIISIDGESILSIEKSDLAGGPFLLSLKSNSEGVLNSIDRNQWKGDSSNWDVTTVGTIIEVKTKPKQGHKYGKSILKIQNIPDDRFIIHHVDIEFAGYTIKTHHITQKKFGDIIVEDEVVLLINNLDGLEIARLGKTTNALNVFEWPNAFEITANFMGSTIENTDMNGGYVYLHQNPYLPVNLNGNQLTGTQIIRGIDSRLIKFIALANRMNYILQNPAQKFKLLAEITALNYKNQLEFLKHTLFINQLSPQLKSHATDIFERLRIGQSNL